MDYVKEYMLRIGQSRRKKGRPIGRGRGYVKVDAMKLGTNSVEGSEGD